MDNNNVLAALASLIQQQGQSFEGKLQLLIESLAGLHPPKDPAGSERPIPKLNVPNYHGYPSEDVGNWIFILKQNLDAAVIPESRRTLVACGYLRDSALQWYRRRLQEGGEISFADFVAGLSSMFLPHNHQEILRSKLDRLKQRGRLDEYITDFMAIMNQISEMSEMDKIHSFKRGLAPRTKAEVGYMAPKTLHEAIEKAQGYDTNYFTEIGKSSWKSIAPSEQMDVSYSKTFNPKPKYDKICQFCKKKGHEAKDCFKKKKMEQHANNFTRTSENMNNEFVNVLATVNKVPVMCLVDTGANNSVISPEVAAKCQVEMFPAQISVTVADGTTIKPYGVTKDTVVTVEGQAGRLDMTVMPNRYGILLGMDFLAQIGAKIDARRRKLLFAIETESSEPQISQQITDEELTQELWENMDGFSEVPSTFDHEELSVLQLDQLRKLIYGNKDMFASRMEDLGCYSLTKYSIKTTTEKPIYIQPYRKSLKERNLMQEEVHKMLNAGIIRKSKSPWSSPVIIVPKPDGTARFCTDYRQLNKVTISDAFPLPRMDDIFDRLSGSKWFSTLDLKSGYWQIELDPDSIEKSAFSTPDGHYEYLRLPFGLKNAPAEFSRIMQQVMGYLSFVEIYLDDITIHSHSFPEHVEHLTIVLKKLREANLKLNWGKCNWAQKSIHLLGHVVSSDGISVDSSKTAAINNLAPPKSIKEVQRFLGMTGYYRKFIKNYAEKAAALYKLLQKSEGWHWDIDQQKSFEMLKVELTSSPILRLPDFKQPFILQTDASGTALGAILSQQDSSGNEYACIYESRLLKGAEVHYGISELECLAIVWAVRKFRPYLYGTKFTIVTDHSSLKWLMNMREATGKLARWSIYLQNYDFEIIHRQGSKHTNVDLLSRPSINHVSGTYEPYADVEMLAYLKGSLETSPAALDKVKRRAANYLLQNSLLRYKSGNAFLMVPLPADRRKIVEQAHLLGHFQEATTKERIMEQYYWPKMINDIRFVIDNCLPCIRHRKAASHEHPAISLPVTGLFDRVGIDCLFGLPETTEGYKGILVLTEYLSKFPYAVPIKSKTASEVASHLLAYISLFGPPKELLSDQGTEFLNETVDNLSRLTGIERRVTSSYHPRTNGLTERFNQTLVQALACHAESDPSCWPDWINFILLAYRSRKHSSTGFSPYELLYGKTMNNFFHWGESTEGVEEVEELLTRSKEIKALVEITRHKALDNISKAQENQRRSKDNAGKVIDAWPTGTQVFIRNSKSRGKLMAKYSGPFTICGTTKNGNYWLQNAVGKKLNNSYPVTKLKKTNVEQSASEWYEVDKVIDHRKAGNTISYLVKWKNYPEEDNTWVQESHFENPECIEEYWASKNRPIDGDIDVLAAGTCRKGN